MVARALSLQKTQGPEDELSTYMAHFIGALAPWGRVRTSGRGSTSSRGSKDGIGKLRYSTPTQPFLPPVLLHLPPVLCLCCMGPSGRWRAHLLLTCAASTYSLYHLFLLFSPWLHRTVSPCRAAVYLCMTRSTAGTIAAGSNTSCLNLYPTCTKAPFRKEKNREKSVMSFANFL